MDEHDAVREAKNGLSERWKENQCVDFIIVSYYLLSFLEGHCMSMSLLIERGKSQFFDLLVSALGYVTYFGQWNMRKGDILGWPKSSFSFFRTMALVVLSHL